MWNERSTLVGSVIVPGLITAVTAHRARVNISARGHAMSCHVCAVACAKNRYEVSLSNAVVRAHCLQVGRMNSSMQACMRLSCDSTYLLPAVVYTG